MPRRPEEKRRAIIRAFEPGVKPSPARRFRCHDADYCFPEAARLRLFGGDIYALQRTVTP